MSSLVAPLKSLNSTCDSSILFRLTFLWVFAVSASGSASMVIGNGDYRKTVELRLLKKDLEASSFKLRRLKKKDFSYGDQFLWLSQASATST